VASIRIRETKSGEERYVVYWRDPDGSSRERAYATLKQAEAFKKEIETDLARGEYVDPNAGRRKYQDWAAEWKTTLSTKKPKTIASYEEVLRTLVLPEFGGRRLNAIRPSQIRRWLGDLVDRGLSRSRIRQAFWVLSGSLKAAVLDDVIRRNPADRARDALPGARTERQARFLTHDEVRRLVESCEEPWRTLITLLPFSGVRWGEAAALRRGDPDLPGGKLVVSRAASEIAGRMTFHEPKSGRNREAVLPDFVAEMLATHMDRTTGCDDDLLFTDSRGGPLRASNFRNRVFKPACVRAGLDQPHPTIHDLRHTCASLMIADGADLTMVKEQLGHASLSVTQRYSHLYPGAREGVAARLDRRWRQSNRGDGVGMAAR
jgi:integrase